MSRSLAATIILVATTVAECPAHGTVVYPASRVYRVYKSNPERPSFALARSAVQIDGKQSYYTWTELSRNIPDAVKAGLPPGFDYSRWVPDGQLASGGRVDSRSTQYPRTYAGLDQVSPDWPKTPVVAGDTILVDFFATAPHLPSVWDLWMTKPGYDPNKPLRWKDMEFLGRPNPILSSRHFKWRLKIPVNRSGHHVLWVAWQRNDPMGEVFFSTSDIDVRPAPGYTRYGRGCAGSNNAVPTWANLTQPAIGRKLDLEVDQAAPSSFAYLLVGRRTALPLGVLAPGCTVLATQDIVLPVGPWRGQKLRYSLRIPDDRGMLGAKFSHQFLVVDRQVSRPLPIALSSGGQATIGWER